MSDERHENGWPEYKRQVVGDIARIEATRAEDRKHFDEKLDTIIEEMGQLKTAIALLQLKAAMFGAIAGAVLSFIGEFLFKVHP